MKRAVLLALCILAFAAPVLAYVGPGAGFAVLGSFLSLLAGFVIGCLSLLAWPFRMAWRLARRRTGFVKAHVNFAKGVTVIVCAFVLFIGSVYLLLSAVFGLRLFISAAVSQRRRKAGVILRLLRRQGHRAAKGVNSGIGHGAVQIGTPEGGPDRGVIGCRMGRLR